MRLKKTITEAKDQEQVKLGGYTWSKIGELEGKPLYLCDKVVTELSFSKTRSNDYSTSDVRKYLTNFYNGLSEEEKSKIAKNQDLGDYLFLLSDEEYNKFRNNIKNIRDWWWLRSPGDHSDLAANGLTDGSVSLSGRHVYYGFRGVRPAFLMNLVDTQKIKELLKGIKDAYAHYKSLCNDLIEAGGDEEDIDKIIHDVNRVL